jgi:hypothetical protein
MNNLDSLDDAGGTCGVPPCTFRHIVPRFVKRGQPFLLRGSQLLSSAFFQDLTDDFDELLSLLRREQIQNCCRAFGAARNGCIIVSK